MYPVFSFLQTTMPSQLVIPGWLRHLLIVLLKLSLFSASPLKVTNGTACTARGPASYILVFTGQWSPQLFPKQYPLFRPPAQWSKLVGKLKEEREPVKQTFCELLSGGRKVVFGLGLELPHGMMSQDAEASQLAC